MHLLSFTMGGDGNAGWSYQVVLMKECNERNEINHGTDPAMAALPLCTPKSLRLVDS